MCEVVSAGALTVRQSRHAGAVPRVHPAAIPRVASCTICSLSTFVSDALGDHMVEAYSSTCLVMALHVPSIVSLCLTHLVEVRTLRMLTVLRALVGARPMCPP